MAGKGGVKKITDFDALGVSGNILDISSWTKVILGGMVLIIAFATSQNLVKKIGGVVPIDTSIDPVIRQQIQAEKAEPKLYL